MADINFFRFPTRCPRYIRDTKGVLARTPYSALTLCARVCIPSGAHMRSINYADSVMQTALLPRCFLCDASFVLFLLLSSSSRDCPSRSYRCAPAYLLGLPFLRPAAHPDSTSTTNAELTRDANNERALRCAALSM